MNEVHARFMAREDIQDAFIYSERFNTELMIHVFLFISHTLTLYRKKSIKQQSIRFAKLTQWLFQIDQTQSG